MKPDEAVFLRAVADMPHGWFVRDVMERLPVPWKRLLYLLKKWTRKGWYEYGVNPELGWLTFRGRMAAALMRRERA